MVSSRLPLGSRSRDGLTSQSGNKEHKQEKGKQKAEPEIWTQSLVVYIFRGEPDFWSNRHVLLYMQTAENPDFHETIHVQRPVGQDNDDNVDKKRSKKKTVKPKKSQDVPWKLDRFRRKVHWDESISYIKHLHAGTLRVMSNYEEQAADIIASEPVPNPDVTEENCQTWLMKAMKRLVAAGLQKQEWYDWFEEELIILLLEGSVDEVPGT